MRVFRYCAQSDMLTKRKPLTQTQGLPKICVTIKSFRGLAVAPPIELQRCNGLKDTIARLSEVILGNQVVEMNIKKSGRDFHITYQFGHAEDDSPALALVEELKEWC